MSQFFPRTRSFFKASLGLEDFRARSADRDADIDKSRVSSILEAIDGALLSAELEFTGLNGRVENVLGRAAVTMGNDTSEYLEREPLDSHHQDLFNIEISTGQRRLSKLSADIEHFRFMKATLLSRYPNFGAPA